MGFFARIMNLLKGALSLFVRDLEKERPEIVYQAALDSMVEKYSALRNATGALIARRDDIDGRLNGKTAELQRIEQDLNAALDSNQDDLAAHLVEKQKLIAGDIVDLRAELQAAISDSDAAKNGLLQVQSSIASLKNERDSMLAKVKSAEARIRIQAQLDGLSVDADVQALDGVREHIKNTVAQAKLGSELQETSLDEKLKKLRATSGTITAKAEVLKLKAARQAANGTASFQIGQGGANVDRLQRIEANVAQAEQK